MGTTFVKTAFELAAVLGDFVHIKVQDAETKKTLLGGPVREIIEQSLLPTNWELIDYAIPTSGKFGTVKMLVRRPKEEN